MGRLDGIALKDHLRESHLFQQRLVVAMVVGGLLVMGLVARLFWLQILHQDHYRTLSENNRVNVVPIPPTRGLIYDRNGVLLAQNLPSFTLELVPEHIDDLVGTLDELAKLVTLTDEDVLRFHRNRRKKRRFEGVPLRFRLSDEEVARLAVNQYRLPGVRVRAELTRHYPLGPLAAHAIGYVGRISEAELQRVDPSNYLGTSHIGKVGIERAYEELLHGRVGFQQVETNAQGRTLKVLERTLPEPGRNLYLNLDVRLQKVAETAFGERSGALVAIDPRTGGVLALVSMPTYDPNLFVNGLDSRTYKSLSESPDRPLFNRALRGQYPPGSTIKPFLGLAGLELDAIRPDQPLNCPGWYMLKNDPRRYRDWKKTGHGETDLTKAIVESCDVYFYDLAMNLGIDRMHDYLAQFGLGKRTGIDIRGELSGLLPSSAWKRRTYRTAWYPGETLIAGIGQGFMLVTPLQLASITATLATYGQRMTPRMVRIIQDPDTDERLPVAPLAQKPVPIVHRTDWDLVIAAMRKVVDSPHGTARRIARGLTYSLAGKTGTAQVFGIKQDEEYKAEEVHKKLRDHALFIGFAPVEKPTIAVAAIVENGGHGGSAAAPIVRQVIDTWMAETKP